MIVSESKVPKELSCNVNIQIATKIDRGTGQFGGSGCSLLAILDKDNTPAQLDRLTYQPWP